MKLTVHNKAIRLLSIIIILTGIFQTAFSQFVMDQKNSFVTVSGTSTLHDWSATSEKAEGNLIAILENNEIQFSKATIRIPVISLKSDKDALDKNMYKALKHSDYPEISYELKSISINNQQRIAKGILTIAGVKKEMETKISHQYTDGQISVNGVLSFKMSEFSVKPPELFLGTIKTGDKIDLTFNFTFLKSQKNN